MYKNWRTLDKAAPMFYVDVDLQVGVLFRPVRAVRAHEAWFFVAFQSLMTLKTVFARVFLPTSVTDMAAEREGSSCRQY